MNSVFHTITVLQFLLKQKISEYFINKLMIHKSDIPTGKVLMIGDHKVGKSSLIIRYTENFFSTKTIMTVGLDFKIKRLMIDDVPFNLQIWDTAGQERYRSITHTYFRDAMGIVLVFDLTDKSSFDNVKNWLRQIKLNAAEEICTILVGNKCDLTDNRIPQETVYALVKEVGLQYFETSAATNTNVKDGFDYLAREIKQQFFKDVTAQNYKRRSRRPDSIVIGRNSTQDEDVSYLSKCCSIGQ